MDEESGLTLTIRQDRFRFSWSLYRKGISAPIKYSVPIFSSEADARSAGQEVLERVSLQKK
jgi:hypothetical protein